MEDCLLGVEIICWARSVSESANGGHMTVDCDGNTLCPTLDVSSQRRPPTLEPKKLGKQNSIGKSKFTGSKVPSMEESLASLLSFIPHGFETKYHQSCGSRDPVVQYRTRSRTRSEDGVDNPTFEMPLQRDLDAAHALVELANEVPGLPKNDLQSYRVNRRPAIKVFIAKLDNDSVSHDAHSRVSDKKAKKDFEKFKKCAIEDQMKGETGERSQFSSSEAAYPAVRKQKERKVQNDFSLPQLNNTNDYASEEDDNLYETYGFLDGHGLTTRLGNKGRQLFEACLSGDRHRLGMLLSLCNQVTKKQKEKADTAYMEGPEKYDCLHSRYEKLVDFVSRLSSIPHGFETKYHQSCGSMDPVVQYRRRGRTRSEDGVDNPTCEMPLQRDLDAAHALVELANEVPGLPKNDLQSHRVNRLPAIKLFVAELDNDRASHDVHSRVSNKKAEKDFRKFQKYAIEDQVKGETGERSQFSSSEAAHPAVRKQKERKVQNAFSFPQLRSTNDYASKEDENLYETYGFLDGHELTIRLGNKGRKHIEACLSGGRHRSDMLLLLCNQVTKKQRDKADTIYMEGQDKSDCLHCRSKKLIYEPPTPSKKQGFQKADAETGSLARVASDPPFSERKAIDDVVPETIVLKKQGFPLITPTIHTGFSFSIIHLLSAIRTAMVTPHAEDFSVFDNHAVNSNPEGVNEFHSHGIKGHDNNSEQKNLPSLTIHEIVQRVRLNPGDPSILETKEPLQYLVRGVLKIFSSKTAPLGAKGWKALTFYEKSTKTWSWISPVPFNSSNQDSVGEEISSEAWGLRHKLLVKLVDCFANWLKKGEDVLQQIGGLPAPPVTLMQSTVDMNERFRSLRNQKSITTISPSSEEVRAYFRREEVLRYLVPDRAFSYTAADGRKSTVAPLSRCSGKPSSKCRDHFMLKPDRPPYVTILCLVRDAAARLPGSIGTRADVCILVRDSQYIVEDVSDMKINQVVSGALDRLHYELDPCVQFDGNRKLWVYLHGEREEDDFQDGGTSSTMKLKWKHATDKSSKKQ